MATKTNPTFKLDSEDVKAGEIFVEERDGETVIRVVHAKNPNLSSTGKSRVLASVAHVFAKLPSGRSLSLSLIQKA